MAEAGGQQQQQQVDAAAARTFAATFLPDPKLAETMPEPDVLAYHGKVKTAVDAAVQTAIKERGAFAPEWRQAIAEDNPEHLKTLERFATPKALYESYNSLRSKISTGELKAISQFPDKGTPEQQASWRAEQGLPAKAEDYKLELPSGVVIGEDDKPFIKGFLDNAYAKNMSPAAVNATLTYWGEERIRRQEAAAVATAQVKQETEDKLRIDWGQEYRPTLNRIEGVLDANLPAGSPVRDKIMVALQTEPDFAHFMANLALQVNPGSTLVPGGAEGQVKSITEWLTKADQLMRTDRKAYNSGEYSKDYAKYATAFKNQTGKEWGKG